MLSTLEAHIIALVTAAIGLIVGLGILTPADGGHYVAIITGAIAVIFPVLNEVKGLTLARAGKTERLR